MGNVWMPALAKAPPSLWGDYAAWNEAMKLRHVPRWASALSTYFCDHAIARLRMASPSLEATPVNGVRSPVAAFAPSTVARCGYFDLGGSIAGLEPEKALDVVAAATGLTVRRDGARVLLDLP